MVEQTDISMIHNMTLQRGKRNQPEPLNMPEFSNNSELEKANTRK